MPIEGINDGYSPVIGSPSRDYSEINKIDFMQLLVAQIRNQDPMSPMNNAEFTSQLTQFSMLDGLEKMAQKLDENVLVGQAINNTAMLALVGKKVTVAGDQVWLKGEEVSESVINATASGTATIEVIDQYGDVVARYTEDVTDGLNDVSWDGRLEDGEPADSGEYHLRVSVENNGSPVIHELLMTAPVTGLRYENNIAIVEVAGQELPVSDIYKVS